jgi:RNA polymerase sigma-70 factor (ECF subfamily)
MIRLCRAMECSAACDKRKPMNALTKSLDELRLTAELVRAAQSGDREAFGRLFERYHRGITAIAYRRLKNVDAARELCQEVFVQAMQKLDQLRTPECFGSWLRSIAVRMAINQQVRRRTALSLDPAAISEAAIDEGDPSERATRAERSAHVRAGLRRLRRLDRETLTAFYVKGRSLSDMSRDFAAPLGTIKRRLHVARKRLAEQIDAELVG